MVAVHLVHQSRDLKLYIERSTSFSNEHVAHTTFSLSPLHLTGDDTRKVAPLSTGTLSRICTFPSVQRCFLYQMYLLPSSLDHSCI